MTKIKIQDDSGDKDFFTIIPNYIANHSTANDQSLYFQMKRFAGENGKCFATEETLMGKMGIGKKAYNKSLNYLLEKKWISYIGKTKGKTRPIKTYKINNIWRMNNDEYKKIPSESTVSIQEIPSESSRDTFQKQHKIPSESTVEEEPYKQEQEQELITASNDTDHKNIIEIFDIFKRINPTINYGHRTNRQSVLDLVKQFRLEPVKRMTEFAVSVQGQKYAPTITTPYQLKEKVAQLKIFYEKNNKSNSINL